MNTLHVVSSIHIGPGSESVRVTSPPHMKNRLPTNTEQGPARSEGENGMPGCITSIQVQVPANLVY